MTPNSELSPQRAQALFDLLTHHETYYECTRFNVPEGIDQYGPPFDDKDSGPSTSPILQSLLYRFALTLPGLRDVSPKFWQNVQQLMKKLAGANLSESYDHGGLGLRRSLATGSAALLEFPARGCFGGLKQDLSNANRNDYDYNDPDDISQAWTDLLQEVVYSDVIDRLFEAVALTDDLGEHEPMIQAAHEYILVNIASVLHYVFVKAPDASYAQNLISSLLKLIPWGVLRQSLRIGNAASMINAVTKLFLTKLSLTSFTNWVGLSNNPDDGMNLLQQIVSTILTWDVSEYQKQMAKIEKSKDAPSDDHLRSIKEYTEAERQHQEKLRTRSKKESKSIVTIIFENANLSKITEAQHDLALKYLGLCLSTQDREQISSIICKHSPDLITQTVREAVAAYDPIIRGVHNAVDLSASCLDAEIFLGDFVALLARLKSAANGKDKKSVEGSDSEALPVTVEDFADVLRKHQKSLHRFLHQMAKDGGQVTEQYKQYAKSAAAHFRSESTNKEDVSSKLQNLITELPSEAQKTVLDVLDNYAAYLMALDSVSEDRMKAVLLEGESPSAGPGSFLARWQQFLDATPVTPKTAMGEVAFNSSRAKLSIKQTKRSEGATPDHWRWPEMPDIEKVVDLLGLKFREILGQLGQKHWSDTP